MAIGEGLLNISGSTGTLLPSRFVHTEEKAKVVAAACGAELIQFLAKLAILKLGRFEEKDELHQEELKKRMNSSYS